MCVCVALTLQCLFLLILLSSVLLTPFITNPSIALKHFTFSLGDNCCFSEGEDLVLHLLHCHRADPTTVLS